MKLLAKLAVGTSILLSVSCTSLNAAYYTVQSGDTLSIIALKLGFETMSEAGITAVPSGDFSKIYPGDSIEYIAKKKKKKNRFHLRVKSSKKSNKTKFCFKDSKSIHYRASERCK